HLTSDVRIHGIIAEGGAAPNIVPERAVARFYFRAAERCYLNQVVEKAKKVAHGAALATGCRLEMRNFELSFDNLRSNRLLAATFKNHLEALGVTDIEPPSKNMGSTDMGNVSHVAPAIQPSMQIGPKTLVSHTHEFCQAAASSDALEAMLVAAKAMALTGLDVLTDEELRRQIRAEFLAGRSNEC
ncbi:MAG: M20 family metallopeptidase, partial [Firmicutes bacterium]|nr:M20 family metallopeptidase [Bacillota bacterium]